MFFCYQGNINIFKDPDQNHVTEIFEELHI